MTKKTSDDTQSRDNGADEENTESRAGRQGITNIPLHVHTQYLKDLSFENPNAPESLLKLKQAPNVAVDINVNVNPMEGAGERVFEVALTMQIRAGGEGDGQNDGQTAFITELTYAGVFALGNVPEEAVHPLLFIECPRLLFPFARSIIGEITRDGGYPPLMINPIDFADLYNKNQAATQTPAGHA